MQMVKTLSGCVVVKQGKILVIRKNDREFYELPGGAVKEGIEPEENAVTKTHSQTGIEPSVIQQFGMIEFQKDGENHEVFIFECDINPEVEFTPAENISEVTWLELKDIDKDKIGSDIQTVIDEIL